MHILIKKKIILSLLICLVLFITSMVNAQDISESWAVRFADSIMQQWPRMSNLQSGWTYEAGIVLHGIQQIYHLTNDNKYFTYIREFIDTYVGSSGSVSYSANTLDDYLSARQLLFLYEQTGEDIYLTAATRFRQTLESVPRNNSGGFWHKERYPNQMWCDGQYMAIPFLIHYGAITNNFTYPADETYLQITLLASHAQQANGLLYHGWDESLQASWADRATGLSPEFWGRGLGWFSMALVDILDYFPRDDSRYSEILLILQRLIPGLADVQDDSTGLWYQILDKGTRTDNWLESSASAMFVYTIHKAVRLGYVDSSYLEVAEAGFNGLVENKINVAANGYITLRDIVQGMGIQNSYESYVNQSTLTNSPHGLGSFLLASAEILLPVDGSEITPSPEPVNSFVSGDVNGDNITDIIDALLIAQYYVGLNPFNFDINNADTNCDSNVDIIDALLAAQYYVGLISEFC